MAITTAPSQPELDQAVDGPEMLFREARRRRRRRWSAAIAAVALTASGVSIALSATGGSGNGIKQSTLSSSSDHGPLVSAARSGVELAGGRWSTLAPPSPKAGKTWILAAWTGRYVIAWGSHSPASQAGSSKYGAAFNPTDDSWRPLPPAPVNLTVESTIWTGSRVFVWGMPVGGRPTHNVLLAFAPATWTWQRLALPPMTPRVSSKVIWSGSRLIVFGGHSRSATALLDGAVYNPRSNRWKTLPAIPRTKAPAKSAEKPVGVTATWQANSLYIWVTYQVLQSVGSGSVSSSPRVQALKWQLGASLWGLGPKPPIRMSTFDATAMASGAYIVILNGSSCLPDEFCPSGLARRSSLLDVRTRTWSPIPANPVLESGGSVAWTGGKLVVISPYLAADGHLLGGHAAAFNPSNASWTSLPKLPVPIVPPSGPVLSGTLWTGSELFDSGLVLMPGHRPLTRGTSVLSSCPPITFPSWVGGHFCGPTPTAGDGLGPQGSCSGMESTQPCGGRMVPGKYYAYTLETSCPNDYIDGRWWRNELPGGQGPLDVWVSVNAAGTAAGWIGPNGAVGFTPSRATMCS